MEPRDESLEPRLERAQATLEVVLRETCTANVRGADTGELIRIDEMLAIAGEAAKEVISVRRRISLDRRGPTRSEHREFDDDDGVQWNVFAVYPSRGTDERARLPDAFRAGWLSFDSGDETRRHSPIPENWFEFTDNALRELCSAGIPRKRSVSKG
jgi:hypothetical protein